MKAIQRATVQEVQSFFGEKNVVGRRDIIIFEATSGKKFPEELWNNKVGHGSYSLHLPVQHEVAFVAKEEAAIQSVEPIPVKGGGLVSREIDVFDREAFIPKVNPDYVQWGNFKTVEKLVKSNKFFTLYVSGESGTGKNAMIEQVCAKLDRPMIRVNFTRDTKEEHLIGSKTLIDGNIVYEDGPVIWAAENGAVLVLDEISCADVNEVMCLQNVMEGGEFFVKSLNRMVKPKEGFAIIASDNTKGLGSDSGRYLGTNVLNAAFLDRFDMLMVQEYPPTKIETDILTKAYVSFNQDVDHKFVEKVVDWVQIIRRTYQNNAIDDMISTRRAIKIIKSRALWFNADDAISFGISRFDDTTGAAFKMLWDKLQTGEIKNDSVEEATNTIF